MAGNILWDYVVKFARKAQQGTMRLGLAAKLVKHWFLHRDIGIPGSATDLEFRLATSLFVKVPVPRQLALPHAFPRAALPGYSAFIQCWFVKTRAEPCCFDDLRYY